MWSYKVDSWRISHTFAVIFAATAPHPRWRQKPCNGLFVQLHQIVQTYTVCASANYCEEYAPQDTFSGMGAVFFTKGFLPNWRILPPKFTFALRNINKQTNKTKVNWSFLISSKHSTIGGRINFVLPDLVYGQIWWRSRIDLAGDVHVIYSSGKKKLSKKLWSLVRSPCKLGKIS